MDVNERARRYRARKRGLDVPKLQPGPKPGYKQSSEHIEKRKRFGSEHPNWKGDQISEQSGRCRAVRMYAARPCESCGSKRSERHHVNGDTTNNAPDNIRFLCRKCHMTEDGRLERFKELAKRNQPVAVAAKSAMPRRTHCPKGHEYVKFNARGCGVCYVCLNEYKRNKRRMAREDREQPSG